MRPVPVLLSLSLLFQSLFVSAQSEKIGFYIKGSPRQDLIEKAIPRFEKKVLQLTFDVGELTGENPLPFIQGAQQYRENVVPLSISSIAPTLWAVLVGLGPVKNWVFRSAATVVSGAATTIASSGLIGGPYVANQKVAALYSPGDLRSTDALAIVATRQLRYAAAAFRLNPMATAILKEIIDEKSPYGTIPTLFELARILNERSGPDGEPLISDKRYEAIHAVETQVLKWQDTSQPERLYTEDYEALRWAFIDVDMKFEKDAKKETDLEKKKAREKDLATLRSLTHTVFTFRTEAVNPSIFRPEATALERGLQILESEILTKKLEQATTDDRKEAISEMISVVSLKKNEERENSENALKPDYSLLYTKLESLIIAYEVLLKKLNRACYEARENDPAELGEIISEAERFFRTEMLILESD